MEIPEWIKERARQRMGREYVNEQLVPGETAFVIIDLQNYYTQPGFMAECPAARGTFPTVNRLAAAVRDSGGRVIWIKTSAHEADSYWSYYHRRFMTPENSARRLSELRPGSPGFEFPSELDVGDTDLQVVKRCYSAFAPGSSELDAVLKENGITTILIGGTLTNACCDSTGKDAMLLNYSTIMIEDALSALTEQEHQNALHNWMLFYGDVFSAEQAIGHLRAGAASSQNPVSV